MKDLKFTSIIFALSFILVQIGCVDSIIDNNAGTPTITVYSPASNDSVVLGQNAISYDAADHANGTGLDHYEVYINGGLSTTVSQNTDGSNPLLFLVIPEAYLDTRISYYVKVINQDGQSKESSTFENILVIEDIPNSPDNLTLTRLNEHSVNLLWNDNSDNETSFELWRKISSSGSYGTNPYKVLPSNTISTDDVGLSPTIEYFYKVRAVNRSGASSFCEEISTSSTSTELWNLKAVAIGKSAVHLTWNDFFQNELGFILERVDPLDGSWNRVQPLPLRNTQEYIDYDVSANTTYQYRITYYTNTTVGPWSNIAIVTTYYTDDTPPQDLVAYLVSSNTVHVEWTDSSDLENGTYIERKKGENGTYAVVGNVNEDGTTFEETISESGKYYYRARHILAEDVYTYYSNEYSVTIP